MTRIRLEYVHEYRDRHGKLRRYFRRPGFKQIALPGLPGSAEFMAACEQALAGLRKEIGADRTKPGTVNAAIVGYYTCLAFRELAPSTQAKRRVILESFRNQHGSKRISSFFNENGGQYRGNPFSEQFRLWCNEAGLPKDCVFHGLRATGCTILADAGCSDHQIAAWSGHKTLKQVESYTRAASQKPHPKCGRCGRRNPHITRPK